MSRYAEAFGQPRGPGDARPTALQIIKDEGLENNMRDKVHKIVHDYKYIRANSMETRFSLSRGHRQELVLKPLAPSLLPEPRCFLLFARWKRARKHAENS